MTTTLDDVSATLPNGFHDAKLKRLLIDYAKREARFIIDIWVGDMSMEQREVYRLAEISLSGLLFWISEPPAANPTFDTGGERIDIGSLAELSKKPCLDLPFVPEGAFVNWVFLTEWNAFNYVAAQDAELTWLGDRTVRIRQPVNDSQIKFPIKEAAKYYSQGDEDRFFGCFYDLPEYVKVQWDGSSLQLTLNTPISLASFKELVALFTRYKVPFNFLRAALPALSTEGKSYFTNSEGFWFAELFSEGDAPSSQ